MQESTLKPYLIFHNLTTGWHCTRCGTTFSPVSSESRRGFARDEKPPENVRQLFLEHACERQQRRRSA